VSERISVSQQWNFTQPGSAHKWQRDKAGHAIGQARLLSEDTNGLKAAAARVGMTILPWFNV